MLEVSVPDVDKYKEVHPVLVDDIYYSQATMIETTEHLKMRDETSQYAFGIHGRFFRECLSDLWDAMLKIFHYL